jgi:hypothetical protein
VAPMPQNAGIPEYIVIGVITLGFWANMWTLIEAYRDQARVIESHKNGELMHLANANIREEIFRVSKQLIFSIAALISIYPILLHTRLFVFEISTAAVSLIMALNAFLGRMARKSINKAAGVKMHVERPNARTS